MRSLLLLATAALASAGCIDGQPCPSPLEACDSVCRDLRSDPLNCGFCGNVCASGLSCRAGACVQNPTAACPVRTGGAFVTLAACAPAQVVKLWSTSSGFIERAEVLAATPDAPGASIPDLPIVNGSDCDGQWTWHPAPGATAFVSTAPGTCDACPREVEDAKGFWLGTVGRWCPQTARVLAVERR